MLEEEFKKWKKNKYKKNKKKQQHASDTTPMQFQIPTPLFYDKAILVHRQ